MVDEDAKNIKHFTHMKNVFIFNLDLVWAAFSLLANFSC